MDLARYVVEAVVLEGRSYREVARAHGVSKSWVGKLVTRFRGGGYEALLPRSRAARTIPHRTSAELEDEICRLRKELADQGLDAGAETLRYHLGQTGDRVPAVSTIWRVLRRRGFITPQPHKRPRSSWTRFEAQLPNECWQSDVTHWALSDGTGVEIVNFIDDHSRVAVASRALGTVTGDSVLGIFREAGTRWGFPSALLTDNGCVYTTWHRGGPNAMQTELLSRGIEYRHSRPYHPQTCGKVERFHQTLKKWLATRPPARSVRALQAQLDGFRTYYNHDRPHRALGRRTPAEAYSARPKATPLPAPVLDPHFRVRRDRVNAGVVTLRHNSRLHHIALGRRHSGQRVLVLTRDLDVRVLTETGELIRRLTLDPTRDYQPLGKG
jgi:transposase InsO family protein